MTTVYISIGTPKTGTTALQSFMRENEKLLEKQGYSFPNLDIGMKGIFRDRNGHFLINYLTMNDFDEKKEIAQKALNEKAFRELKKIANQYDNIILSDEQIWYRCNYTENFWQELVNNFKAINCKVKIIVYLRRQDQIVQSLWNQLVKMFMKKTRPFKESIEAGDFNYFPLDYYKHLKGIEKYVGKENLIVRPYERGQFENGSLYNDYFGLMGVELTDEFTYGKIASNVGLDGNFIEIKRIINGVPEYRVMDDFMCRPVLNASMYENGKNEHVKTSLFTYDEQVEYMKQYEESNRKVAAEYLGKTDEPLFLDEIEEMPTWKVNHETMYRDIVISMTEIFCKQQTEIRELRKQQVKTEAELKKSIEEKDAMIESMYNSFIFRMYRKIRRIFKGN